MAKLIRSLNVRGGVANAAAVAAVAEKLTNRNAVCDSASDNCIIFDEIRRLVHQWNGLGVVIHRDPVTDTWIFIALHDASLGPMVGGLRLKIYDTAAEGLQDSMRLAEAMTRKWAIIGYLFGGAKAVLAANHILSQSERAYLFRQFGLLLESLQGIFTTGQDLGTTPADINIIAQASRFVHGIDYETGDHLAPAPYTALGVFAGIKSSLKSVFGTSQVAGRRVLIQGTGQVGRPLARLLRNAGAIVLISEANEALARELSDEIGCKLLTTGNVSAVPCDVYSPCALGGVLTRQSSLQLRCAIVAGAANNQLEDDAVADVLHGRGILYAPDFVINAGGAIALPMFQRGTGPTHIRTRVEKISDTLSEIFTEATSRNRSPLHSALGQVERTIADRVIKSNRATLLSSPVNIPTEIESKSDSFS